MASQSGADGGAVVVEKRIIFSWRCKRVYVKNMRPIGRSVSRVCVGQAEDSKLPSRMRALVASSASQVGRFIRLRGG